MADRADHPNSDDLLHAAVAPRPQAEAARIRFAAARVRALEGIERRLLELAVGTSDDTEARWLELWADTAWRDAEALCSEHGAEGRAPD